MGRSKNEVRNADNLPTWFSLSNYDGTSNLTAGEWYALLKARQWCMEFVCLLDDLPEQPDPEYVHVMRQENHEQYLKLVALIRARPLESIPYLIRSNWFEGYFGSPVSPPVRSMTVGDLFKKSGFLSRGRKEYASRWYKDARGVIERKQQHFTYREKPWINRPLYESNHCDFCDSLDDVKSCRSPGSDTSVVVNLDMPDSMLIEAFKEWLTHIRLEEGVARNVQRFRKPDLAALADYGVLPYLDLTIWAKENGVSIPNRIMADALFGTYERDAETVRKTVAPLAANLLRETVGEDPSPLDILKNIAALESATSAEK